MDELTARINALDDEMREHPERFVYAEVCDQCGKRTERQAPKDEIDRGRRQHPEFDGKMLELTVGLCEACAAKEPKDDE